MAYQRAGRHYYVVRVGGQTVYHGPSESEANHFYTLYKRQSMKQTATAGTREEMGQRVTMTKDGKIVKQIGSGKSLHDVALKLLGDGDGRRNRRTAMTRSFTKYMVRPRRSNAEPWGEFPGPPPRSGIYTAYRLESGGYLLTYEDTLKDAKKRAHEIAKTFNYPVDVLRVTRYGLSETYGTKVYRVDVPADIARVYGPMSRTSNPRALFTRQWQNAHVRVNDKGQVQVKLPMRRRNPAGRGYPKPAAGIEAGLREIERRVSSTEAEWRKAVRRSAGVSGSSMPIVRIAGIAMAPRVEGQGYYYTNKRGQVIRHPTAYRRAWGKPIYHASTQHILVGADWGKVNPKKSKAPRRKARGVPSAEKLQDLMHQLPEWDRDYVRRYRASTFKALRRAYPSWEAEESADRLAVKTAEKLLTGKFKDLPFEGYDPEYEGYGWGYGNPSKSKRLGAGGRFASCVRKVRARGSAYDPKAVCGAAAIRKYGKRRVMKWAQAGKRRAAKIRAARTRTRARNIRRRY